uniref:Uncharacterized protein n=1 Tax=Poecilia latipinna TaxID=48699 RepID=A0A3B3UJX7_9TELE
MAPFSVIDLLVAGLELCFSRAHIDHKVIGLQFPPGLLLFGPLRTSVAEQQQSAGLGGAEVEGDGACLLGVPLWQRDESFGSFERDGVESRHVLAAEHQVTVQRDLRVAVDGQPGELQFEVVVLVHHL